MRERDPFFRKGERFLRKKERRENRGMIEEIKVERGIRSF